MRIRRYLPALVAAAVILGGCSGDDDQETADPTSEGADSAAGDGTTAPLDIPDDADFNDTDIAFSQGMIPHHGQAVQMADMALEISTNSDITSLAEQIKAAQSPEIEQMSAWLTEWGQAVPDPDAPMDENMEQAGDMMMSGMMSEADMERLGDATGTEFDRMFLELMILHHEGAIEMAEQQLADGKYEPTMDLAQAVISGQQAEIEEMNALLADLSA